MNILNKATKIRPTEINEPSDLSHYWLKKELIKFCQCNGLSSQGSKLELTERIAIFLTSGEKKKSLSQSRSVVRDSDANITRKTLVVNYYNDASTRLFFQKEIGPNFKFNAYLRQFSDKSNIVPEMTYGDLVDGWINFEKERKTGKVDHIPKQFEYNQFIKDYFGSEKNRSLKKAIEAWKVIKSINGPNTYKQYKHYIENKK